MTIRVRYVALGAHVHCRVFLAPAPDQTFALVGELVFRDDEFTEVRRRLRRARSIEFLADAEEP